MTKIKDHRNHIRVSIKQLPSIVHKYGDFEVIEGSDKFNSAKINITDISYGGLCIESKHKLQTGVLFNLEIPKLKSLEGSVVECEVTRSIFREDPLYHVNLGTDRDKSTYEIGLKFKVQNTEYLKELYKFAVANQT